MKIALALMLAIAPMWAQSSYRKHNFAIGGGVAVPGGELDPYLGTAPAFRFGYGYRFMRFFQADFGLDVGFGSADVKDFYDSEFGELRIRDYQYMLPLGGRVVIPIADEKVQLYAGGGAAWLKYAEVVRQPFANSGYRIDCPVCRERSGWGTYGLAGVSVALDRAKMFRLGVTTKVYRATTDGDSFRILEFGSRSGHSFGTLPAIRTKDRWINVAGEFTISF